MVAQPDQSDKPFYHCQACRVDIMNSDREAHEKLEYHKKNAARLSSEDDELDEDGEDEPEDE